MGTACSPCKGNLAVAVIAIAKGCLTLCGSRGMDWQPGKAPTLQQVGWAPANSNPMLDWEKKQKDADFLREQITAIISCMQSALTQLCNLGLQVYKFKKR